MSISYFNNSQPYIINMEDLSNNSSYIYPKGEVFKRFDNYANIPEDQRGDLWHWLGEYLMELNLSRRDVYDLYFDMIKSDRIFSEKYSDDFDYFYSAIVENGIANPSVLSYRFKDEPEDYFQRRDYVRSEKWLK